MSSESDSWSLPVHIVVFLIKDLHVGGVANNLRDSSVLTEDAAGLRLKVVQTLSPALFAFLLTLDELSLWEVKGPIWGPFRFIMISM